MYFLFKEKLTKKWKDKKRRSFQMRVLERGHRQRKQKKEKENTCGRNEKTRREKRDNRWRNGWTKGWHKEVMHASKRDNLKSFFETKRKMVVQTKIKKVKVKKMSPRRRRSRK